MSTPASVQPPPAAPAADRLPVWREFARLTVPDDPSAPRPVGPLDPSVTAHFAQFETIVAGATDVPFAEVRTAALPRLRAKEQPYVAPLDEIERQFARIDASPDAGTRDAGGARFLLRQQAGDYQAGRRAAVHEEVDALRAEVATIRQRLQETVAADADPPVVAPAEWELIDDLLAFGPHVIAGERLKMAKGLVGKLSREPLTSSGRGALRHVGRLLRTWETASEFDRTAPGSADRGEQLARLRWTVEQLARDPAVEAARGGLQLCALAEYELDVLERAVIDLRGTGEERTAARMALRGLFLFRAD